MFALFVASAIAHEPPPHVAAWRDAIDWALHGDEVARWLSAYIQIDTVAPPGNERDGAEYLADVLHSAGIETEIIDHGDNRASLIARVSGDGSEPPLCLLSHIDVVPSETERWTTAPLGGEIRDGYVWGRGALDMKGMGVVELSTMVQLARLGVPLKRDVVLLAVADEEVDGLGMKALVNDHWDRIGCSHLINEGGLGLEGALLDGQTLHAISVAEKGTLWVRLIASGRSGHGSTIEPDEAPTRLLAAMRRVEKKYKAKARLDPIFFELFRRAGEERGGLIGGILKSRLGVRLFVRPKLMGRSTTRAALTDTLHLTGMGGASSVNVVPTEVWAQYDSRLLLGTDPDAQLAKLERLTRKLEGVRWERLDSEAANGSPWDDPLFERIAHHAVDGRPGHAAGPVLSVGFTDSIFARPLGVRAYGYVPFVIDQDEALTMHGHDERVSLANLRDGARTLFAIAVDFAGAEVGPSAELLDLLDRLRAIPAATDAAGFSDELRVRADLHRAALAQAASRDARLIAAANGARLQQWMSERPLPTRPEFDDEAAAHALHIALHADDMPGLQLKVSAALELLADDLVDPRMRPVLYDRIAMNTGRPQWYGTAGTCAPGSPWAPHPIDAPEDVDARRSAAGLPPLWRQLAEVDCDGSRSRARMAYDAEDWAGCEAAFAALGTPYDLVGAARCAARAGRIERALELVVGAIDAGYDEREALATDPDLATIRADSRGAAVLAIPTR